MNNKLCAPSLKTKGEKWAKHDNLINYRLNVKDGRHISVNLSEIYKRDEKKIATKMQINLQVVHICSI